MFISLKSKIWLTIFTIVLMFTFFTLYYFPNQQGKFLLKDYNNEVQSLANTVSLGVRIALDEQDYKGVQTALEYVKNTEGLHYASLVQYDTVWDKSHNKFHITEIPFETYPKDALKNKPSNMDSLIIKRSAFSTSLMTGAVEIAFTTKQIDESKKQIRIASLIVSGAIFLVGILIGLWLSRNISKPVIALRNAAKKVSTGDLTAAVKSYSADEIGELAKAFNMMVKDLYSAREQLKAVNNNLSASNNALNKTLDDLKAAQAQLIHAEKMASLGELTAGIAHEIQNPLNFVNNFAEINNELIDDILAAIQAQDNKEIQNIAADIKENNNKIIFHGNRADGIVKGMLQHSRKNTGQKEFTDINALADEYLRLSFHGLRAKDKTFNAAFETNFDKSIGKINIVPQDVGRVLLNLYNNAFYALVTKKKTAPADYRPLLTVTTKKLQNATEVRVSDNAEGIPQNIADKIFQPFFTTKPTGQGTGLGLSLSYDIVTKEHNGTISMQTKEGEGTTFIITLPL